VNIISKQDVFIQTVKMSPNNAFDYSTFPYKELQMRLFQNPECPCGGENPQSFHPFVDLIQIILGNQRAGGLPKRTKKR
jgi:hypothetical protein